MKLKRKMRDLYFQRKLEPLHTLQGGVAWLEKQLYRSYPDLSKNLSLPTFIGIGATKAGTTWLYRNLYAHPEVFLPETKEIHYFDRRYDEILYAYTRKFKQTDKGILGEITPAYAILDREKIEFIRLIMPDVRLIYILRNPIDRAWSEAMHNLLRKPHQRAYEDVHPDEILAILQSNEITQRSQYTQNIENWVSIFPEEQLLVLFYDDLRDNPRDFMTSIFNHIGVTDYSLIDTLPLSQKFNVNPATIIPSEFQTLLKSQYCEEINRLYERFGDKVAHWLCD